jgi:hypothetical protein
MLNDCLIPSAHRWQRPRREVLSRACMRFLMDPADSPHTGCDQDIELNASCTGYVKHQTNAMNSSSLICTKTNKRHLP